MRQIAILVLAAAVGLAHAQSASDRAQYRNVGLYKSSTGKGGDIVCGEGNAKNSYGAYVGFQRFAVWREIVVIDRPDDPWRDTLGPKLCHELVTLIP